MRYSKFMAVTLKLGCTLKIVQVGQVRLGYDESRVESKSDICSTERGQHDRENNKPITRF